MVASSSLPMIDATCWVWMLPHMEEMLCVARQFVLSRLITWNLSVLTTLRTLTVMLSYVGSNPTPIPGNAIHWDDPYVRALCLSTTACGSTRIHPDHDVPWFQHVTWTGRVCRLSDTNTFLVQPRMNKIVVEDKNKVLFMHLLGLTPLRIHWTCVSVFKITVLHLIVKRGYRQWWWSNSGDFCIHYNININDLYLSKQRFS